MTYTSGMMFPVGCGTQTACRNLCETVFSHRPSGLDIGGGLVPETSEKCLGSTPLKRVQESRRAIGTLAS